MEKQPSPNFNHENPTNLPEKSGVIIAEERALGTIEEDEEQKRAELESAHEEALTENAARSQEADQARHKIAIETRRNSPEVQALNDLAELEIYGSRGKTYVHPQTGERLADKDRHITGVLDSIKNEPAKMHGTPMKEREAAKKQRELEAKKYERDLLSLVENHGFELCQAKLVMDLREKDKTKKAEAIKKLNQDGAALRNEEGNRITPIQKMTQQYKKLDANRIKIIKNEGAFTEDEYIQARRGVDLYDANAQPKPEQDSDEEETPPEPETEEVKKDKERSKNEIIENISSTLAELKKTGNHDSRNTQLLEPVKKRKIFKSSEDIVQYPELLGVRAPDRSIFKNLSRDLEGHKDVGEEQSWLVSTVKDSRDDEAKDRIITPDGRIYEKFIKINEGEEDKSLPRIAVDVSSLRRMDELPEEHLEAIEKTLALHLEDSENSTPETEDKVESEHQEPQPYTEKKIDELIIQRAHSAGEMYNFAELAQQTQDKDERGRLIEQAEHYGRVAQAIDAELAKRKAEEEDEDDTL